MPRGDGTGLSGHGPGTGHGLGKGQGRGRMGGKGLGVDSNCVCPNCGRRVPHKRGTPCYQVIYTKCGAKMIRQ